MFYVLSKVIGLVINPIVWILVLLGFAIFVKSKKYKKSFIIAAFIFVYVFSNSFLLNEILYKWELKPVNYSELKPSYDYGIVLSGMLWYDSESDRVNFMQSSDRIWQAVKLYKEGRIRKILISGGAADFFNEPVVESVILKDFLIKIGIPAKDIIAEQNSRNTYENAQFTANYLDTVNYSNLLLITSATHMRRSKKCFYKVGLHCDIYPVDYYSGIRKFSIDNLLVPSARTLFNWNAFIHELFGMLSYKIVGYI
ncbi:MAG: YdcF family protein [Salinivirgaceae bacterium]|nr:YdcF family protein [Salinivirgaceae bacterium]